MDPVSLVVSFIKLCKQIDSITSVKDEDLSNISEVDIVSAKKKIEIIRDALDQIKKDQSNKIKDQV